MREVRRRCYFGCVLCGMPVFEYHHIVKWSEAMDHAADNIVLLCSMHHAAVSTRKLSNERVLEACANPFNQGRALTAAYKIERNRSVTIELGSNKAGRQFPENNGDYQVIWVSGQTFLCLHCDDGWLSVSMTCTSPSGEPLLVVRRGELVVATETWDYEYVGSNLKVKSAARGKVVIDLDLANDHLSVHRASFIDNHGDGFVVDGGALHAGADGRLRHTAIGSKSYDNAFGGWGLNNSKYYPAERCPGGFGFFIG